MCDLFDDGGIGAEEMGLILGITDEMGEESRIIQQEEPLTFEDTVSTDDD